MSRILPAGIVTAYGAAVRGGYTGTYQQFCAALGDLARVLEDFEGFSVEVTTLNPGASATADYSDGVLTLGIPRGDTGNGIASATLNQDYTLTLTWTNGQSTTVGPIRGATGQTPNLAVGTVQTLEPEQSATVTITGTAEDPVLNFGIPKGDSGDDGVSPAVTITEITDGHRVTITDEAHPAGQTFDVMDGQDGASDAGQVTYDPTQTYPDGSIGKEVSNQKNAIDEITEETYNLVVGKLEGRTINPQGTRVINAGTDLWAAPVEQGKTYTVKTQDNSGLVCGFFTAYPLDPNQGATTYNNSRTIQANNYTITAPIDGYIAFRSNSGYLEAQIVEGSVDKDYLPPVTAIDSVARNAINQLPTDETADELLETIKENVGATDVVLQTIEKLFSGLPEDETLQRTVELLKMGDDRLQSVVDNISASRGDDSDIELTDGKNYWGTVVVGVTQESSLQESTASVYSAKISLPATNALIVSGCGVSSYTRLFFAFNRATGIAIDIAGDESRQGEERCYCLSYDVDANVYVNFDKNYGHYIKLISKSDPLVELFRRDNLYASVMTLNDEKKTSHAIRSMRRGEYGANKPRPAIFLHFSDIHGDAENLQRIVDFSNDLRIKNYIDNIICSGDIVRAKIDDGMSWYEDVPGSDGILIALGNHDVSKNSGSPTKQEVYNTFFAGKIENWGVVQPEDVATSYKMYYYKDYTASKLRVIFLDSTDSEKSDEATWLEDVLEDAYNNELSVMCVEHFPFAFADCTPVDCTFASKRDVIEDTSGWTIPNAFISAVETFIGYGGDFVCWLSGHVHTDHITLHSNGHQFCVGVSCATYNSGQTSWGDDLREFGSKSQDLFNAVAIDTAAKKISILRLGCDLSRLMNSKHHLCLDYKTKEVVWND